MEWQKITKKIYIPPLRPIASGCLLFQNISKFVDFHDKPLHLLIISVHVSNFGFELTFSFIGDTSNLVRTIEDLRQKQIPGSRYN